VADLSPSLDYFSRKWLEEFRSDVKFPPQRARFPIAMFVPNWNQPHYWLGTTGNDDLFAAARFFNQARQLDLRPVNGDGFHVASLQECE
jgi:hypothetical protein